MVASRTSVNSGRCATGYIHRFRRVRIAAWRMYGVPADILRRADTSVKTLYQLLETFSSRRA